jgi:preprotein translocase subunit SecG
MSILIPLLYLVFCLSAVVLIVVVLLQEGRGGGFGAALGTHGQETFGPGARGINNFTMAATAVFLVTAVAITFLHRQGAETSVLDEDASPPSIETPAETPAPAPGTAPPPAAPSGAPGEG